MDKYSEIYVKADALIKQHDPCNIKDGWCTKYSRDDNPYGKKQGELCCHGCEHHSAKRGCRVKALSCKLWLCGTIRDKYPVLATALDKLYSETIMAGINLCFRRSKSFTMQNSWKNKKGGT